MAFRSWGCVWGMKQEKQINECDVVGVRDCSSCGSYLYISSLISHTLIIDAHIEDPTHQRELATGNEDWLDPYQVGRKAKPPWSFLDGLQGLSAKGDQAWRDSWMASVVHITAYCNKCRQWSVRRGHYIEWTFSGRDQQLSGDGEAHSYFADHFMR